MGYLDLPRITVYRHFSRLFYNYFSWEKESFRISHEKEKAIRDSVL